MPKQYLVCILEISAAALATSTLYERFLSGVVIYTEAPIYYTAVGILKSPDWLIKKWRDF